MTARTSWPDVPASDYSAGLIVATGTPGALDVATCGPGGVSFFATAGTTYYVLAFDDQYDGGGNGGNLAITFGDAPPPPTVTVVVNKNAQFNKNGSVTLSGTITCADADFAEVYGTLKQRVGRMFVAGDFGMGVTCDGTTRPFSADVTSSNGLFKGGKAASVECAEGYDEQTVQISGGPKK